MMLWEYVHRGWAKRAWKSGYDWAVRSRLTPIKRVSRLIKDYWDGVVNAEIPDGALDRWVRATADTRRRLGAAAEGMGLSARAARRLLRVARTVADLAREEKTGLQALAEALRYRATRVGEHGRRGTPRSRSQLLHGDIAQPARRPKIDTGRPRNVTWWRKSEFLITQLTSLTYCK